MLKYLPLEEELRINELAIIAILEYNITPLFINYQIDPDVVLAGLQELSFLVIDTQPLKVAPAVNAGLLREKFWNKIESATKKLPPNAITLSEFGKPEAYNPNKRYIHIKDNIYQAFPDFISPDKEIVIEEVSIES